VQSLRLGLSPRDAAEDALSRIERYFAFAGALVVVDREGHHAAAAFGIPFWYSIRTADMNHTEVIYVKGGEAGGWNYVQPTGVERRRRIKEEAEEREREAANITTE
jgi:hypothetical protein